MTTTHICVALLVLFGALLAGKMLRDMFPGTLSNAFKAENDDAAK
ncbi:MAG: hypothetical protein AAFN44_14360 [Pseudomonadota bacterium]|mgnify:FL=1